MGSSTRTLISLLIVFFLMTATESVDSGGRKTSLSTFTDDMPSLIQASTPVPAPRLTPQFLRTIYGLDPLIQRGFTGKGQTVIVPVTISNPTMQQDMQLFDQTFNLPPVDLQVIPLLNIPKGVVSQKVLDRRVEESQLDVETIHSIAPEAKIIVLPRKDGVSILTTQPPASSLSPSVPCRPDVYDAYSNLIQRMSYATDHQFGYIVSDSSGGLAEAYLESHCQQALQQWVSILQQGTIQHHMTYFLPSGDAGNIVSLIADVPWVTGVGGTGILRFPNSPIQEVVWKFSGGGFSHIFQMPSYQKLLPAAMQKQFNGRRGIPDVSAVAGYTGFRPFPIYVSGQYINQAGGTSFGVPIWAGIMAIANQMAGHPLGFINPGLYKLAASATYQKDFHDIVEGNNGYQAIPGWDPVTGLGAPNAEKLIPDLIAAMK